MSLEPSPGPPLRAGLLHGIRVLWVIIAILTLAVFAVSVQAYFYQETRAILASEHLALKQIGLTVRFRIVYTLVLHIITMLVFAATAAELFWLRSDDWIAILVSTALPTFGAAISPTLDTLRVRPEILMQPGSEAMMLSHPVWHMIALVVRGLGIASTLLFFYLFPDGRFVPRWIRWLALIWGGLLLALALVPTIDPYNLSLPLRFLPSLVTANPRIISQAHDYVRTLGLASVLLAWFGSDVLAQIYRYTHVSTPVQRQQTKWVVFGLTAAAIGAFAFYMPPMIVRALRHIGLARSLYHLIGYPIYVTLLLLVPVSIRVSILRYRPWRIDPIIQRALVYDALTGALAVLYVGCVLLFQQIFRRITGYQSTLAVAVSTLMIAALVTPLRRRLQDFTDWRFYRERVDFRHAFTNFSNEVRTIIELPELLRVLVNRTTDLLHIAHGAVFLRKSDGTFQQAEAYVLSTSQTERAATPTPSDQSAAPSEEPAIAWPAQLSLEPLAFAGWQS